MLRLLVAILLTTTVNANREQFSDFFNSIEKWYLVDTTHLKNIADEINLKKIGIFASSDANALYYPLTNTIALNKDSVVRTGRKWKVKKLSETNFREQLKFHSMSSTVLHELAHADFDVFIEEDRIHPLHNTLTFSLIDYFKKKYFFWWGKHLSHEYFGYSVGDALTYVQQRISDVLSHHGLYQFRNKCFGKKGLVKIAKRLGLHDNLEFKDTLNIDFFDKFFPDYIFINGKDYDSSKVPRYIKHEIFEYLVSVYGIPRNSEELVEKMNNSYYSKKLRECYYFL